MPLFIREVPIHQRFTDFHACVCLSLILKTCNLSCHRVEAVTSTSATHKTRLWKRPRYWEWVRIGAIIQGGVPWMLLKDDRWSQWNMRKKEIFRERNHTNRSSVYTFIFVQLLGAGLHHFIIHRCPRVFRMELGKNLKVNLTYRDKHGFKYSFSANKLLRSFRHPPSTKHSSCDGQPSLIAACSTSYPHWRLDQHEEEVWTGAECTWSDWLQLSGELLLILVDFTGLLNNLRQHLYQWHRTPGKHKGVTLRPVKGHDTSESSGFLLKWLWNDPGCRRGDVEQRQTSRSTPVQD